MKKPLQNMGAPPIRSLNGEHSGSCDCYKCYAALEKTSRKNLWIALISAYTWGRRKALINKLFYFFYKVEIPEGLTRQFRALLTN